MRISNSNGASWDWATRRTQVGRPDPALLPTVAPRREGSTDFEDSVTIMRQQKTAASSVADHRGAAVASIATYDHNRLQVSKEWYVPQASAMRPG